MRWSEKRAWYYSAMRYPTFSVLVVLFFFQSVMTSAFYVIVNSDDIGTTLVGVAFLILYLCMNLLIYSKVVGKGFEAEWQDREIAVIEGDGVIPKLKRFWLMLSGSGGAWIDKVENSGFKRRYSIFFANFRKDREWFVLVDTGFLTLFALIGAFEPETSTACIVSSGCLTFVFLMYIIVFVYLRPTYSR